MAVFSSRWRAIPSFFGALGKPSRIWASKNGPHGSYYAYLRGKRGDDCDWLRINKFPSGYEYPMHVNHAYWLFTILSGTLVLGFDQQHRKSGERFLPAGTIMQGLVEEPHYGRAIGETIFEIYAPCLRR